MRASPSHRAGRAAPAPFPFSPPRGPDIFRGRLFPTLRLPGMRGQECPGPIQEQLPAGRLSDGSAELPARRVHGTGAEDIRNTVGNIPMEWYQDFPHIGYDLEGKKIYKPIRNKDELDLFLDKMENPDYWRTVQDKMTGADVKLTDEQIALVQRLQKGHFGDVHFNPYEPAVDFFTHEVMLHPVSNRPADKRSFIPSLIEKEKVSKLVHAIKMGWIKPRKPKDDAPTYYDLWAHEDPNSILGRHKMHVPAPKMKLPGHEESYNPPPEYLLSEEERLAWQQQEPAERRLSFVPQQHRSLRAVPAFPRFIHERFERCLDLYLCPRQRKMRVRVRGAPALAPASLCSNGAAAAPVPITCTQHPIPAPVPITCTQHPAPNPCSCAHHLHPAPNPCSCAHHLHPAPAPVPSTQPLLLCPSPAPSTQHPTPAPVPITCTQHPAPAPVPITCTQHPTPAPVPITCILPPAPNPCSCAHPLHPAPSTQPLLLCPSPAPSTQPLLLCPSPAPSTQPLLLCPSPAPSTQPLLRCPSPAPAPAPNPCSGAHPLHPAPSTQPLLLCPSPASCPQHPTPAPVPITCPQHPSPAPAPIPCPQHPAPAPVPIPCTQHPAPTPVPITCTQHPTPAPVPIPCPCPSTQPLLGCPSPGHQPRDAEGQPGRISHPQVNVDPEDLIPKLPKPRDLQPFPTTQALVYRGHTSLVRCLSISPSGQWLVSGSDDGSARFWEVSTARCLRTLPVGGVVKSLAWNPNPSICLVAIGVEQSVLLVNPCLGDKLLYGATDQLLASFVPPEEERVQPVRWVTATAEEHSRGVRLLIQHSKAVKQVTWHGKGDYFASVVSDNSNLQVLIHQCSKRWSQNPFRRSKGLVQCVLFHPVRPYFFVATQRYVRVYNLLKQELTKKLMSNCKWVSSMAIHPGGDNIICGSYDSKLAWFDLDLSTRPYQVLRHHKRALRSVAFHKRYPLFASASDDGTVIVCHGMVYNDLLQNPLLVPVKVLKGHALTLDLGVLDVLFHPTQPWVFSSGADGTVRLYT
ncbi:ribosome biogenesis protein BOP1-like isoform X2 [Lathamus discolor]|uniref:ribosome biogenesis protein BOP1-like isoform X2 n=1 Tax=Lathamus discolor TaxID=678569 RepID=UPI0032B850B4